MIPEAFKIIAMACTVQLSHVPTHLQARMLERAQGRCYYEMETCVKRRAKTAALKAHLKKRGDPGALLLGIGNDTDLARDCVRD
jgi:hypothetical protein